jgi:riboflavin biosynthesis pyrimidine reductase
LNESVIPDRSGDSGRVTLFHVVSVDGDYVDEYGSSRGVSNAADLGILLQARSDNDVAITGGKTARAEKLKSTARCALCLVSNSMTSLSLPLLAPSDGQCVLLASSNPELLAAASGKAGVDCITLSDGLPLARQLVESLRSLGLQKILLEGGPQLILAFAAQIDEVHLTVTGSDSEMSLEAARGLVSGISYLPKTNNSLTINFDGVNNYLVWLPSGVAAQN